MKSSSRFVIPLSGIMEVGVMFMQERCRFVGRRVLEIYAALLRKRSGMENK